MKVRIIEKIYHHTNCPILTPYRTDRELFWIKELGTAMPYGCNDQVVKIRLYECDEFQEVSVY
jgi:hypothetical protein